MNIGVVGKNRWNQCIKWSLVRTLGVDGESQVATSAHHMLCQPAIKPNMIVPVTLLYLFKCLC